MEYDDDYYYDNLDASNAYLQEVYDEDEPWVDYYESFPPYAFMIMQSEERSIWLYHNGWAENERIEYEVLKNMPRTHMNDDYKGWCFLHAPPAA